MPRRAAAAYGVAALAIVAWGAQILAERWYWSICLAFFAPLTAYAALLGWAALRVRPGAEAHASYRIGMVLVFAHAAAGALCAVVIAVSAATSSPAGYAGIAAFFLVLFGWVPSVPLQWSGHAAGWLLLVSLLGAAWLVWIVMQI